MTNLKCNITSVVFIKNVKRLNLTLLHVCCRLEDGDFPLLSNSRTFPHLIVSLSELKALAFNDDQEKVVNKVGHVIIKQNVPFERRRT